MKAVFIDTHYWIARVHPKDQWHEKAVQVGEALSPFRGVTTDAVLIEVANYFCAFGADARGVAAVVIHDILDDPDIETIPHTRAALCSGLARYAARLDKRYSLTDCISMDVMNQLGLTDVLTQDKHFAQEGFNLLF